MDGAREGRELRLRAVDPLERLQRDLPGAAASGFASRWRKAIPRLRFQVGELHCCHGFGSLV